MTKNSPESIDHRQRATKNNASSESSIRIPSKYYTLLPYTTSKAVSRPWSTAHLSVPCAFDHSPAKREALCDSRNCNTTIFAPNRSELSASDSNKLSAPDGDEFSAPDGDNRSTCSASDRTGFLASDSETFIIMRSSNNGRTNHGKKTENETKARRERSPADPCNKWLRPSKASSFANQLALTIPHGKFLTASSTESLAAACESHLANLHKSSLATFPESKFRRTDSKITSGFLRHPIPTCCVNCGAPKGVSSASRLQKSSTPVFVQEHDARRLTPWPPHRPHRRSNFTAPANWTFKVDGLNTSLYGLRPNSVRSVAAAIKLQHTGFVTASRSSSSCLRGRAPLPPRSCDPILESTPNHPLKVLPSLIFMILFAATLVSFVGCTFDPAGLSEENGNTNFGCGNGIIEETEECDDGNLKNGDGCSDQCIVQSGWECAAGDPSVCNPICGDEKIYGDEECDDGNTNPGDGCDENCRLESGYICEGQPSVCYSADCGDGVIQSNEECDDGNDDSGDGCSATCEIEPGWECTGQPSYCAPLCGDGIITADEECDDENTQSGDGCSNVCNIEPGYECSGEPSVCVNVNCGDGWLQPEEECDDSNNNPGDGCSANCKIEPGWECSEEPSICHTICGDGIIAGTEECDDLNTAPDDGCSADCKVEPYFRCSDQPSVCTCAVLVNILSTAVEPDGLLWSTAYTTVQEGINQAASLISSHNIDHCEVWVARGNYNIYNTNTADTITLASNVEVYGGFQGTEAQRHQRNWETNITILDGRAESLETNRVHTVVKAPNVANSIIDGFSIIYGQNSGNGGGLHANNSLFKIANINFTANSAQAGGAAHLYQSTVDIINCEFQGNTATSAGGGINSSFSDITVTDSSFANNNAITSSGGGIHIYQGSGDFANCIFKENTASTVGGGMNCSNTSSVIFSDCDFLDNHSISNNGGGISFYQAPAEFHRCGFHDNSSASNGGGVCSTHSDLYIAESTFSGNASATNGGAVYTYYTPTTIQTSTFGPNNTAVSGGAIHSSASTLYVSRSFFNENDAAFVGGAIMTATNAVVENSVFTDNQGERGGAVAVAAHNTCAIINSLIYSNISQLVGGGLHVSSWGTINLTNNIIWLNEPDQLFTDVNATTTVRHCNIENGYNNEGNNIGNIDTDPLLVDPANGDYHLQSNSPCIDAADGDIAPEFDLEGNPRVDDPATTPNTGVGTPDYVDIGPYEYQP